MSEEASVAADPVQTHSEKVKFISELISDQTLESVAEPEPEPEAKTEDVQESVPEASLTEDAQPEPEPEAEAAPDDDAPVSLGELAKSLDVEDGEIYAMQVNIGDGESATIGQLKDAWKEYGPVKEYETKVNDRKNEVERQLLATRAELNAILSVVPEQMRQAMINQGQQHNKQWVQKQDEAVLEAIPEWADADKRADSRAQIIEMGAEYGFSEPEMAYTQDARTLKMLNDFNALRREVASMRASAKGDPGGAVAPVKSKRSSSGRKLRQAIARERGQPHTASKTALVSQLIRNQR